MIADRAAENTGSDWPLRPWLLAGLLGLAGLLIGLVTDGQDDDPVRMAIAAFLFFGSLSAAVLLERERWKPVAIFAVVAGLVMAGLVWHSVRGDNQYAGEEFSLASGVLATAIALLLFQSGFHRTRFATPYREVHFHVWTDAINAGGSFAFLGLTWGMTALLANLFQLLKIDLLMALVGKPWFAWTLSGLAFGAALGVLRNKLSIIAMLQAVATLVLSLLAVPLALALVIFLLAMLFSGPEVLWEATRIATPILLACAAGAFALTNAIVRDEEATMSANPLLRVASLVLALTILPLTVFAAISMGTRVAEYGLSPERMWALVAVAAACSVGVAYLVVVVRGRLAGWHKLLRRANLNLAAGLGVVALFLALPILNFAGISAENQLSRLERGVVSVDKFDFDALAWRLGKSGEKALAKLAASGNAEIAKLAKDTQYKRAASPQEWIAEFERRSLAKRFEIRPSGSEMPEGLKDALTQRSTICHNVAVCRVFLQPDGETAAVVGDGCAPPLVARERQAEPGVQCSINVEPFVLEDGVWHAAGFARPANRSPTMTVEQERESLRRERAAIESGDVTVGPSQERQIYIDGKPVGPRFD